MRTPGLPASILSVVVQARGISKVNAELGATQASMQRTTGRATAMAAGVAKAAKLAALGLAAGAVVATKAAIDYDKEMRNVNSIAQLGERRFGKLKERVLALAGPTAQAPTTLAAGMYDLVSSGFDAEESLLIVEKAARAASAGLTTTEVSTAAVAAVLNAYRLPAEQASDVSDVLFRTVDRGVISFESLASNVGDVLPFAASLDVNLREVGASIATMTKAGISAPETMTRIKAVMVTMLKPGEDLAKVIRQQGFESGESMIKSLGFQGTLERLARTTGGSKEEMAALFPNIRALGGALALTGDNAKVAGEDLAGMNDAAGATARALSQQEKSFAFQWQRAKASATAFAIELGEKLLPTLNDVMDILNDPKLDAAEKFRRIADVGVKALTDGLERAARVAGEAGPGIMWSLAQGMVRAWDDMSPLGKLFTVGVLIRAVGGKGAILRAGGAVGALFGTGVSAGAAAGVAGGAGGGAAGGAAAGGAAGILAKLKAARWARIGGLAVGAFIGDQLIRGLGDKLDEGSDDLRTRLEGLAGAGAFDFDPHGILGGKGDVAERGMAKNLIAQLDEMEGKRVKLSAATERSLRAQAAELDLTKEQRRQLDHVFRLTSVGRRLGVKVDLGVDPEKLRQLEIAFGGLRGGVFTSMEDIQKVVKRNMGIVRSELGGKSAEGRKLLAENFEAAAQAIQQAMDAGAIPKTKQGLAKVESLFRNAKLVSGQDPLGIAKGFADSWEKAGGINSKMMDRMIADLGKMPKGARQKAFDTMLAYARGLVRGKKVPLDDFRDFRSKFLSEFDGLRTRGGKKGSIDVSVGEVSR